MSAHTPGPWEARNGNNGNIRIVARGAAELSRVAYVPVLPMEGLADVAEADARLIAAAPDLLAELKALHFDCGVRGCSACAAIARAEGKS